jgi:hypothetical protein
MLVSVATAARGDMQYFAPSTDESLAIALSFFTGRPGDSIDAGR